MKNGLFFLFFLLVLGQSCTNTTNKEGFITIKPGHFCKVGSIIIVNGTIYISGSFIKTDNPDATIPLRQSYIASIDTTGKVNWQIAEEKPDYTHWDKLVSDGMANIYAVGTVNSPFSSKVATYMHLTTYSPASDEQGWIGDSKRKTLQNAYLTEKDELAFMLLSTDADSGMTCLNKQVVENWVPNAQNTSLCVNGSISATYIDRDSRYLAAWGDPMQTQAISFVNDTGAPRDVYIPSHLQGMLVNTITALYRDNYLLTTTTKNGQGPCLYQLNERDSIEELLCLDYWPLHGSTLVKPLSKCKLVAFNATDSINGNAVHVALINHLKEVAFEQTVKTSERFILSDVAVYQSTIYLAGTLETEADGSSIAIKAIKIPSSVYTNCVLHY